MEKLAPELEKMIKKELEQLTKQTTLSGSDLDKMIKATCALDQLESYEQRKREESYGNSYGNSYGYANNRMSFNSYGDLSYAPNRSKITGRFMARESRDSRDSGSREYRDSRYDYDRDYSAHSIHDRMIYSLEKMYDEATSPHERHIIDTWISKIKNGE